MFKAIFIISLISFSSKALPVQEIQPSFNARTDVRFLVFTQANRLVGQQVTLGNIGTLRSTNYDGSKPTRVIIHGFQNDASSEVNTLITEAYLRSFDFNVVVGKLKKIKLQVSTSKFCVDLFQLIGVWEHKRSISLQPVKGSMKLGQLLRSFWTFCMKTTNSISVVFM